MSDTGYSWGMTGHDNNTKGNIMATKTQAVRVTVQYWLGTTQATGTATTYRGAMRLAAKNSNACSPKFYDGDRELVDDGSGLAYVDEAEAGRTVYAV